MEIQLVAAVIPVEALAGAVGAAVDHRAGAAADGAAVGVGKTGVLGQARWRQDQGQSDRNDSQNPCTSMNGARNVRFADGIENTCSCPL